MTEKICIKCQERPAYVGPRRTYSYCEECDDERRKASYQANREANLAKARRYRERRKQSDVPVVCPRCGETHVGRGSDNYCLECRRAYHRERRTDPEIRESINARQRARYYAHHEEETELRRKYRQDAKRAAIDAYGGVCACCGEHRIELLAIDHINGNGKEHRKQASGTGHRFYRWLARQGWPQGELRVLCHNCNLSRGLYGYCPHERERTEGIIK